MASTVDDLAAKLERKADGVRTCVHQLFWRDVDQCVEKQGQRGSNCVTVCFLYQQRLADPPAGRLESGFVGLKNQYVLP